MARCISVASSFKPQRGGLSIDRGHRPTQTVLCFSAARGAAEKHKTEHLIWASVRYKQATPLGLGLEGHLFSRQQTRLFVLDPFSAVIMRMALVILKGCSLRLKWLPTHFDIDLLNLGGKEISHIPCD